MNPDVANNAQEISNQEISNRVVSNQSMNFEPNYPEIGSVAVNLENVATGYGNVTISESVSTSIAAGTTTVIIGPNGCGKSTLLHAINRLGPLKAGTISIAGKPITSRTPKQAAKLVAFLPQHPIVPDAVTVRELVTRGRYPHRSLFAAPTEHDRAMVDWALEATNLTDFAERPVSALSGGQRQRAWIATALAQETPIIMLDEPTTYLDMSHQLEVVDLLRKLQLTHGVTTIMVLHDLGLAARVADRIIAMKAGEIVASGTPEEVLTKENIRQTFGFEAAILHDASVGHPVVAGTAQQKAN